MSILLGVSHRLPCRLIALRVPQEVADRRRQKAYVKAQKHGRVPSREYLEWQDWTIFVTNCEPELLTWEAVVVLYRARWQIELMFKLWKSRNRLATHRAGATAEEQLAVVYVKLITVLVQHWILLTQGRFILILGLTGFRATSRGGIRNVVSPPRRSYVPGDGTGRDPKMRSRGTTLRLFPR